MILFFGVVKFLVWNGRAFQRQPFFPVQTLLHLRPFFILDPVIQTSFHSDKLSTEQLLTCVWFLQVRSLAGFIIHNRSIDLQPGIPSTITITPSHEISSDLELAIEFDIDNIVTAIPSTFTISPPRQLIGSDIPVSIGLRVVLSEKSQRFPRVGPGEIKELLSDNLDLVAVAWDSLPDSDPEEMRVGLDGIFSLALEEVRDDLFPEQMHVELERALLQMLQEVRDGLCSIGFRCKPVLEYFELPCPVQSDSSRH